MPRKAVESPTPNKLAPLNIRTTVERRARIEDLARQSGRSLTQEIEHLLDFALDQEARFGGEELAAAVALIGQAAAIVLGGAQHGLAHFKTRAQVVAAIKLAADWAFPPATDQASEDLAIISFAVADLGLILPHLVENFDPTPLALLGQGYPLPADTLQQYSQALQDARVRHRGDSTAVARVDEFVSELLEAQQRATLVQRLIWEQSRLGESKAIDALLRITRGSSVPTSLPSSTK